jgi:pimeloyl-ACP methyl ester carboxylesterase
MAAPPAPRASVFFVHPTSFLDSGAWNAPVTHEESQWRAGLFVQSQASTFNGVSRIWAPKYRQATFGAFLTDDPDARRALDFAYQDVLAAYEQFLKEAPKDQPIILAGHSQGSLHVLRLLQERVKGSPEQRRIAAAYVIGWPISTVVDLPELPLPACTKAGQAGCILSWLSFSEPADPAMIVDTWDATMGLNGQPRRDTPMLCVNPITGNAGDAAPAEANLGTLIPNQDLSDGTILPAGVPARCDGRGFLLIGTAPPDMGPYVLPGNNYHVYDYTLFWSNLRADVEARLATFTAR